MVETSVIIPAYNEERYIGKALESLNKQTYKNFEIIVVDDGSTDKTREIVNFYPKVRLIEGEHKGPGFSRNLGAKRAKGIFLVFVDADMAFHKDYLFNLVSPMKKDKKLIGTTHDYEIATNIDNIYSRLWGEVRVSKESAGEVKIFRAIRKNEFTKMGGFDSKYGYADDQTFWFKYKIKPFVAKNTTCYHRNPETIQETYKQARWIGMSWKSRFKLLSIPLINIFVFFIVLALFFPYLFFKSINVKLKNKDLRFTKIHGFFYSKFKGYIAGLYRAIFSNEVRK